MWVVCTCVVRVGRDDNRTLDSAKQKSGGRDLREGAKLKLNFQWHLNIPGKGLGTEGAALTWVGVMA